MVHRMLRYPAGWEWHVLQQARGQTVRQEPLPSRKDSVKHTTAPHEEQRASKAASKKEIETSQELTEEQKRLFPESATWIDECSGRRTNHIAIRGLPPHDQILCGTLMIQISEDQTDVQPLHFWLSQNKIITMQDDMRSAMRLQSEEHTIKLNNCDTAQEAFFVMISILLRPFHTGLDGFENRLGELENSMRRKNRTGLLNDIFERRYELLHWSHLFIPVRELHGAAKEAFMEELTEMNGFKRFTHKLERIDMLLQHYTHEIDTLLSMDEAIASFRGNDIMKTLTIFTVMFLPSTVAGAIWGSNFDKLPWEKYEWGFTGMMTIIIVITVLIYIWLWKKGWTGDLLNARNSKEVVADNLSSRGSRSSRKKSKSLPLALDASRQETVEAEGLSRRKRTHTKG